MSNYKKGCISAVLLFFMVFNMSAQSTETEKTEEKDPIFKAVDENPTFPGGLQAFQRYLALNLIVPKEVKAAVNVEYARNSFSFLIEKDGTLSEVEVLTAVQEDYDNLIKTVLLSSPKWLPAKKNGSAVRYRFIIPITMNMDKLKSPR